MRPQASMRLETPTKGNWSVDSMTKQLSFLAVAATVALSASAQPARPVPTSSPELPAGTRLPSGTSAMVWAGNTLYVSGSLDPDLKTHTDTTSQTVGVLQYLKKLLESQKLALGDVVMMHVYLGGELGKPDFDGMMAGYTQFFGTKDQPNKPARTTVQVVLPAGARGALIEIDLVAVRRE
jgi:enamine deaminase RidA (YjgF/YER057c/UK114 family)